MTAMDPERRPCARCEDLAMEDAAVRAALLRAYVDSLAPRDRVPPEVYGARLARCAACPSRREDLCVLCGCYVQARAAKARLGCPDVKKPRWGACPDS